MPDTAPEALTDLLAALEVERGDDTWVVAPDGEHTFASMWEVARRVAHGLRDRGVREGDVVALFLRNGVAFLEGWFGAVTLGAVAVPVNTGFKHDEARYVLEHSDAVVCVVDAATSPIVRALEGSLPNLKHVFDIDHTGATPFEHLTGSPALEPEEVPRLAAEAPAGILYTSGTTGPPKGCLLGHDYYLEVPRSFASHLELTRDDVLLCVLPLFHMNAQTLSVLGSLTVGARLILEERFKASTFWDTVRTHRVTEINYLGVISSVLYKQPPTPHDRDHDVRVGFGAGIPAEIHEPFEQRFGFPMIEVFGMTETGFDLGVPLRGERRVGSRTIGKPVPGKEARVIAEDGGDASPDEPGDLVIRGPALFKGYYKDPDATREALTDDGWFRTGDLAKRGPDGWYYYVDRRKDLLRRAGENISSVEVETVIKRHPDVYEVAVIGAPDDVVGQEVMAVVVARPEVTPDGELAESIMRSCEERLSSFKVPRYVRFVEGLPRTRSEKIQKHHLRELYGMPDGAFERTWRPQ